jgi:hypothetical protein
MTYVRKKDGVFLDLRTGKMYEHRGYARRIFWNRQMLDDLKRMFPTTLNDELAGCLGVSPRTLVRKARELGLEKDPEWLRSVWEERRQLAHAESRRKGHPGRFQKGRHYNPDGEFRPGHRLTDEQRQRQADGIRRWCLRHPEEVRERSRKIAESRRARRSLDPLYHDK